LTLTLRTATWPRACGIVSDKLKTEMSDVLDGSKKITDVIIRNIRPNLDLAPPNKYTFDN